MLNMWFPPVPVLNVSSLLPRAECWISLPPVCMLKVWLFVCMQVLDRQDFAELAYHILKGDQLIVRGNDITTVTSIINILKASMCVYVCY